MKRPKSHYRTGKFANLIKFVMDSLSGHNGFFLDDNQIVCIYAEKIYSDKPRTEILKGIK